MPTPPGGECGGGIQGEFSQHCAGERSMRGGRRRKDEIWPTLALAITAIVAGTNWVVLRFLQAQGLESAWAGLALSAISTVGLLPLALRHRPRWSAAVPAILLTGLANGGCIALYTTSMLLTDVVRTLVLFYLSPMWGALLGLAILGERVTAARILAMSLCFAGMVVILGLGRGWPWPRNIGDWLAILSGLAYAYGSLRVYRAPEVSVGAQSLSAMAGSTLVSGLVLLVLPEAARGAPPPPSTLLWAVAIAYSLGMIIPINWVALWTAKHLAPARVGLIFALEAVVGIISAALLLDEPFGWREAVGSALVVSSTVIDVLGHRPVPAAGLIPAGPAGAEPL